MIRQPAEIVIGENGEVVLSLGLLAEAGLNPGDRVVAFSSGDGRIVVRRFDDALQDLLAGDGLG